MMEGDKQLQNDGAVDLGWALEGEAEPQQVLGAAGGHNLMHG